MTGKPGLDKILLTLSAFAALASMSLVLYSHFMIKPQPTDSAKELERLIDDAHSLGHMTPYKIKKMVVNLYSRQTRLRYLSLELDILPFSQEQKQLIQENEDIIKDITISLAGGMSPEELNSLSGKILLENRIKKAANSKLNAPVIKKIFFSNFVIQ